MRSSRSNMFWNSNANRAEKPGTALGNSSSKIMKHQKVLQLHLAPEAMNSHLRRICERVRRWYLKARLNRECKTHISIIQRWYRPQSTLSIVFVWREDHAQAKRLPLWTWRNIWQQRGSRCSSYPRQPPWWWKVVASSRHIKWLWWTKYASRSRSWSHKCA